MNIAASSLPPGPLMIDLAGLEPSPEELRRLAHPAVGGVILFARNYRDSAQLAALVQAIRSARPGPLVIAVDQEGGRVQRFRGDGFTPVAPMRRLGDEYERDPEQAVALAYDVGLVIGAELAAHGIDLTFAPVLDVEAGVSAVIGDRAFSDDAGVVARLAQALVAGLAMMGVRAVGKHFPGHGAVAADSHETLPVDSRPFEAIWQRDLVPYRHRLLRSLAGVMPAHVRYERCAPEPAGFSAFWLGEVLRARLGFRGAVLSDDLGMAGAGAAGDDPRARVAAALSAGCDLALVCNRPEWVERLLEESWPEETADVIARRTGLLGSPRISDLFELELFEPYLQARERVRDWSQRNVWF
ncbi:MAG: beta-N-acetylhexosaminidase [Tepidiphilus sp.]|nr:beta-N-acetylhexosaminidase [Tepidiphilus sp.]